MSNNAPEEGSGSAVPRGVLWLATAGGAGYGPIAPGTWGSAVGVVCFLPLSALHPALFALTTAALLFVGIWAADRAEIAFGRKDDGRIVIDEVVGQLITLFPLYGLPSGARPGWLHRALLLGGGFVLFRLFDIWKPGPARWAERRFAGGAGVMLDDVVAGLFAAAVMTVVVVVDGGSGGVA